MQAGKPQRNARDQRAGDDDPDAGQTSMGEDEEGLPLPDAPDEGDDDDALSSGSGRAKGRRK